MTPIDVTIAGGGVAAVETLIALHELAGDRVRVTLVAPEDDFTYRPLTVAEPFALGHAEHHPLRAVAGDFGASFVCDAVREVLPGRVRLAGGDELAHDVLVVATGGRPRRPFVRGITFGEPGAAEGLAGLLADVEQGYAKHVTFVVGGGTSWPLPLYELALMTAADVFAMGIDDAELTFVTPEDAPLGMFGNAASAEMRRLLTEARIAWVGGAYATALPHEVVLTPRRRVLRSDRIVTLPLLDGPALPGLPADAGGFIPVDAHGQVEGLPSVYAAGDAIAFPIKQGGLATQQADAVAEAIAARAGAPVTPAPVRPVLRGCLLSAGPPLYMENALTGGRGEGAVAGEPLWWPPHKIAGRFLAPYLHELALSRAG